MVFSASRREAQAFQRWHSQWSAVGRAHARLCRISPTLVGHPPSSPLSVWAPITGPRGRALRPAPIGTTCTQRSFAPEAFCCSSLIATTDLSCQTRRTSRLPAPRLYERPCHTGVHWLPPSPSPFTRRSFSTCHVLRPRGVRRVPMPSTSPPIAAFAQSRQARHSLIPPTASWWAPMTWLNRTAR